MHIRNLVDAFRVPEINYMANFRWEAVVGVADEQVARFGQFETLNESFYTSSHYLYVAEAMTHLFSIASPRMFRVAKLIGRKDYPNAIRELEANLHDNPSDEYSVRMLVECYRWSGLEEKAIEVASSILGNNPNDFFALKTLGEIYSVRNESDRAAAFVRRALENYPEPTPGAPPRLIGFVKFLAKVFPPLRHLKEEDFSFLVDPNTNDREWFDWAKRYLAWHNGYSGGGSMPTWH